MRQYCIWIFRKQNQIDLSKTYFEITIISSNFFFCVWNESTNQDAHNTRCELECDSQTTEVHSFFPLFLSSSWRDCRRFEKILRKDGIRFSEFYVWTLNLILRRSDRVNRAKVRVILDILQLVKEEEQVYDLSNEVKCWNWVETKPSENIERILTTAQA